MREVSGTQLVRRSPAGECDPSRLHPRRHTPCGYPLLEERFAVQTLGKSLQRRRTIAERPHDSVADRDVVVEDVTLRESAVGKVDLVWARQSHGPAGDLDLH